jgi:hypothetical protein
MTGGYRWGGLLAAAAVLFGAFLLLPRAVQAADYPGADGGYLVYSIGTIKIPMSYTVAYRQVSAPGGALKKPWRGSMACRCVGFIRAQMPDADFTGRETGKVVVTKLPPGKYEIYDYGFGGAVGMTTYSWSSGKKFSIPFEIRPGEATYIGSFARAPSLGTSLEPTLGAGGFFVISDRSERDLPLARKRFPALPEVREEVTDVSTLGHPAIFTAEPR